MRTTVRASAFAILGLASLSIPCPLAAQQRFSPRDVAQIADAVIQALVPPEQLISRVSVAQRSIVFDRDRTLRAFGYREGAPSLPFPLHSHVKFGTQALLSDCGPAPGGGKPCGQLGWAAYLWIEPVSLTGSEILVRAHLVWPDRGAVPFEKGVAPVGRASLVGYAGEVYLTRSPGGVWRFVRRGVTAVF